MKNDHSIRNRCIFKIKRSTFKPIDFPLTKIFETEVFTDIYNGTFSLTYVNEHELPIAQVIIDKSNWTLVTTRKIITCIEGITKMAKADSVLNCEWSDFKGYAKTFFTIGSLQLNNQHEIEIFIETGKASMIIIYAIKTLIGQVPPPE